MTEIERQLASALERLEKDYERRDQALQDSLLKLQRVLNARLEAQTKNLILRLDDTRKRLELMTEAYNDLLTNVDDLMSQLGELQRLFTD